VTIKSIRWFETPRGVPAAFHNSLSPGEKGSFVVCLNYKDYDNLEAGVEAWFLTHELNVIDPSSIEVWASLGHLIGLF
jgi:hypothetical protein